MFKKFNKRLLTYKSPIRWAIVALVFAVSLFCFEISLSCYSLCLSLVEGGVVVGITWLDNLFFAFAVICGIAFVLVIALFFYLAVFWYKNSEQSNDSYFIVSCGTSYL